jgi:23S rRNA pseudouridine2605 synthase
MKQRLQKVLAQAGVASRRAADQLVQAGRVTVNGAVVSEPGSQVDPERDVLAVDGRQVAVAPERAYYLVYKPIGYVSTAHDERGRPAVVDLVARDRRVYPVGRLDADSEGLVLLTDDGALAHRVTHPRYGVEKEYHVMVRGEPTRTALERLRAGVRLEEGRTAPAEVRVLRREPGWTWLSVVLRQGWKRQVRRMLAAVGHPVERLIRVRIGGLEVGGLRPGEARPLTAAEAGRALEQGGRSGGAARRGE